MIIKLTNLNDAPIFLNGDNIVWFEQTNNQTSIRVVDGQWINVKESADFIMDALNQPR